MATLSVNFELPIMFASQAGLQTDNISHEIRRIVAMFLTVSLWEKPAKLRIGKIRYERFGYDRVKFPSYHYA